MLTMLLCVLGTKASKDVWSGVIDGTSTKSSQTIATSNFESLMEGDHFVVTLTNYEEGAKISLKEAGDDWTSLVYEGDANTGSYTTPAVTGDLYTNIKTYGLFVEIEKAKVTKITIVRKNSATSLATSNVWTGSVDFGDWAELGSNITNSTFADATTDNVIRFTYEVPSGKSQYQIILYQVTGEGWSTYTELATINLTASDAGSYDLAINSTMQNVFVNYASNDTKCFRVGGKGVIMKKIDYVRILSITESANPDCEAGTYDVVKLTRSLKAGYNSLCLPFGASKAELGLDDADKIYELATSGSTASSIKLSEVDAVTANQPYIVNCAAARDLTSSFTSLAVSSVDGASTTTYDGWTMHANYTPSKSMNGNYMMYNGELRLCGSGPTLNGLRAYFTYSGLGARDNVALDFGDVTGVKVVENTKENVENICYNLNGQRVAQPRKGLYIVNGKKIIIK